MAQLDCYFLGYRQADHPPKPSAGARVGVQLALRSDWSPARCAGDWDRLRPAGVSRSTEGGVSDRRRRTAGEVTRNDTPDAVWRPTRGRHTIHTGW